MESQYFQHQIDLFTGTSYWNPAEAVKLNNLVSGTEER